MKFKVTFKTPDAIDTALQNYPDITDSERTEAEKLAKRFVVWEEYVDIEFDTDKGTATVVEK